MRLQIRSFLCNCRQLIDRNVAASRSVDKSEAQEASREIHPDENRGSREGIERIAHAHVFLGTATGYTPRPLDVTQDYHSLSIERK